jgi:ssDNA-binding Zn-finger/Zn-ribbon topoisomerase 1
MHFYLQYFLSPSVSFAIVLPLGFPTCNFYVQFSPSNRKNVAGFDVSLASPASPSDKSSVKKKRNNKKKTREHWWNAKDSRKSTY